MTENPLLSDWAGPFGAPPLDEIENTHFLPAFEASMAESRANIEAIATDPAAPTFANTVEALERASRALDRVCAVFFNLTGVQATDEIETIQTEISPKLALFGAEVASDPRLFARVDALMERRSELGLTSEQDRVLELTHLGFQRSGAQLDQAGRDRMGEIMERLSALGTAFAQHVLADEKSWHMQLGEDDLAGLPESLRDAAAAAAKERGIEGWAITLQRSLITPLLESSERRDLRERAFQAWIARGENGGETDNREIVAETLALRKERAELLGFENFAAFKLAPEMAKTPDAVRDLLMRVWTPARAQALSDAERLTELLRADGVNGALEAWDWRFYAEKLRKIDHDLDASELKPFMPLDAMIWAAFDVAARLFGLGFEERDDIQTHHPEARVWEVTKDGRHMALFVGDYFGRATKRSGAWCSRYRSQETMDGEVRPIVVNVMSFAKAPEGQETLLTFDDARTLFHEFGHALHHILSDVTYPSISGTSVARDFVELPSQLYEHWLEAPAVLAQHARHVETGEPMPSEMIDRVVAAQKFDQGFTTVEYVASALVDLDMHVADEIADPMAFEAATLERIGMPPAIEMRHRTPHFQHVFSGDGYSSGYYSYMWSEVMDADAFGAFEEAGDLFDPEVAARLAKHVYSAGNRRDPAAAYQAFRGRDPDVDALLEKRGLVS